MDHINYTDSNRNLTNYISSFHETFGGNHILNFVRAPGRVNIIGEHIDYCGYSVLPMAIENDILITFASIRDGDIIHLCNTNEIYKPFIIKTDDININDVSPKWHDYFLCGYRGIMDYAKDNKLVLEKFSLLVMVDGSIPPNSGLSSSSALVVCAALTTMKAFNINIPTKILAKVCASCEKYIGTQGGGMDQTISLMAIAGSAMLIDFSASEFTTKTISLPDDAVFVVTNTHEQMNKAATNQFNQRVVESKLSAKVLLTLVQPNSDTSSCHRLVDVQKKLGLDFCDMLKKIDENLHETYSKEDLIALLQVTEETFNTKILSKNTQEMTEFRLRSRAKHVISEARRVIQFTELCSNASGSSDVLREMGLLMNDSQQSCRDLYGCSSERLDSLVDVCRKAGSHGSRLTGAGWGGCVISLLSKGDVDFFLEDVAENFYHDTIRNIRSSIFVSKPSDGASFLRLTE